MSISQETQENLMKNSEFMNEFNHDMRKTELKIKSKDLAEESKSIKKEEKKSLASSRYHRDRQEKDHSAMYSWKYVKLREHRIHVVREHSRAVQLARAFLNGMPYEVVEDTTPLSSNVLKRHYFANAILKELKNSVPEATTEDILDWIKA
jgi:hypothetical protein